MIGDKIAVLDLGSYKIKLLIISLDKNNYIDIHAKCSIFSSGIKKGDVSDIEKLSFTIKSCIQSLKKETNIEIKEVYVGINSINFNFTTFGVSRDIGSYEIEEKKDLQSLINLSLGIFYNHNPNKKIIHFLNSGFYLDKVNNTENPIGLRSNSLDVNFSFISLNKNLISNYEKALNNSGLKVKKYFYSPFASSILSSDQEILEKGFINIDFGFDKTTVTFFENSKLLFSKIIPIGSFHINNDLIKAIDVDKNLAEHIKYRYDDIQNNVIDKKILSELNKKKISSDMIIQVINARVDEIIDYIYEIILYCKSLNKAARKIIITGGGSDLKVLSSKLSKKFNIPINYAKQSFPIKDTEFSIFSDYMACLGIAKMIFFPNKDEIKSFKQQKKGFFNKFYSLFLK